MYLQNHQVLIKWLKTTKKQENEIHNENDKMV